MPSATRAEQTSPATIDLYTRFGTSGEAVLARFNPSRQIAFCRDIGRVHFGSAPRLGALADAYGYDIAVSWMMIQLNDLSMFAGCKDKLSTAQIEEMSQMIVETYPHFNLVEFMLFFQRFKQCRYGRFYGAVDPMVILQALAHFSDERNEAFRRRAAQIRHAERVASEQERETVRRRYAGRIPGAFTDEAPMTLLQYRLLGYDTMPDDELRRECADIKAGRKSIPADVAGMLARAGGQHGPE